MHSGSDSDGGDTELEIKKRKECPCGNRLSFRRKEFCSGWCEKKYRIKRDPARLAVNREKQRERKVVPRSCERCSSAFRASRSQVKAGQGRFCSPACAWADTISRRGERSHNWKGDDVKLATVYRRNHVAKWPEKDAARRAVQSALLNGSMKRGACERCGDPKSQGHHDDYCKPLEVRWLCRKHHLDVHRELRATGVDPDQHRARKEMTHGR